MHDLLHECSSLVQSTYHELGHRFGWRLLTGPRAALSRSTNLGLITLNPGGGAESAHQSGLSYEAGSSYVVESWLNQPPGRAPLQQQVQALARELMGELGESGSIESFLASQLVTGHFIPFRSPSIKELHQRVASIAFGRQLWLRILREWRPKLILTIDRQAYNGLLEVVAGLGGRPVDSRSFATGWGSYCADATRVAGYRHGDYCTIARLPHLSRFALFAETGYSTTRKEPLSAFFCWACEAI